jgi:subtilisin family serine protease
VEKMRFTYKKVIVLSSFLIILIILLLQFRINKNEDFYCQSFANDTMNFSSKIISRFQNSKEVKIAILDSGIDSSMTSLNKYAYKKIDCVSSYSCKQVEQMEDYLGHGTHMARIITSEMGKEVDILPIKVIRDTGIGEIAPFINGMKRAISEEVNIINISLQIDEDIEEIHSVIKEAAEKNITIVASSGNDSSEKISYPARYEQVISVGSYNRDLVKSDFSQYGIGLDFIGPGECPNSNYEGTSLGSAFITKAISLLYLKYDSKISTEQVYENLKKASQDINSKGYDIYTGYGIINVEKLLK